MGELQNAPMPSWMADGCDGFEFRATFQLRTPLRVLLRHGELYLKNDGHQPQIAREMWEGIWLPNTKSYEEIACGPNSTPEDIESFRRIDVAFAGSRTVASEIGPVRADDYLPFLIAIRKIVELNDTMGNRIAKLREMLPVCDWQEFLSKHGGTEKIVQYFFPRHIRRMPKLPASTVRELSRLGLNTPNRIAAPDEMLLGMKGIGPAKLQAIREHCADMAKHRDADRVENVIR